MNPALSPVAPQLERGVPSPPQPVVRRARVTDRPMIDAFIAATYEELVPFKLGDRFDWQFIRNPLRSSDALPYWIAIDEDRGLVAGAIAVQEGRLVAHQREHAAGWIVDVMVHPAYRGLGLGHRIHAAVAADVTTLVTLTMAPATRRIAERHGCVTLGPVFQVNLPLRVTGRSLARYVRFRTRNRRSLRMAASVLRVPLVESVLAAGVNAVWGAASLLRPRGIRLPVQRVAALNEADLALLAQVRNARPFVFDRTESFFRWRFLQAPELRYEIFRAVRGNASAGLLVLRVCREEELPAGVIVDLLTLPGDTEAIDTLIAHALQSFACRAEAVDAAASTDDLLERYRRWGFIRTRTMRPTVVCSDAALRQQISAGSGDWYFSKADHDWDQVHVLL